MYVAVQCWLRDWHGSIWDVHLKSKSKEWQNRWDGNKQQKKTKFCPSLPPLSRLSSPRCPSLLRSDDAYEGVLPATAQKGRGKKTNQTGQRKVEGNAYLSNHFRASSHRDMEAPTSSHSCALFVVIRVFIDKLAWQRTVTGQLKTFVFQTHCVGVKVGCGSGGRARYWAPVCSKCCTNSARVKRANGYCF